MTMGRELYFDLDPGDEDYEAKKAAVENIRPYDNVSVKSHHVNVIAEAAEALDIEPARFRELMRVPDSDDSSNTPDENKRVRRTAREFTLSSDEVQELCAFTDKVLDAIDQTIDLDDAIERFHEGAVEKGGESYLGEFEMTLVKARFTLSIMAKMCEVAETHDLGMEVL